MPCQLQACSRPPSTDTRRRALENLFCAQEDLYSVSLGMFPWSALFSLKPKVPGQRTPEELVTNTLMMELGALVKHAERQRLERAAKIRRRSSSVDYTWLAGPSAKPSYELTPGEVIALQDLCAKIPPSQCGPVILRFRKMVSEFEPEAHEVPRIFRSLLSECLDEEERDLGEEQMRAQASQWKRQHRSQSLSFITFHSKFHINPFRNRGLGGSRFNLTEEGAWSDEEEEREGPIQSVSGVRRGRSRSMPEIIPMEEQAQS
ncbi:hypothetical protein JZ751_006799 [Albula glossodonta]|uniref:Protein RD3 n=1 Tax=Albula glossodonta TaxID=121402 RepID=A0A8T2PAE6_9TELE|nr:hypothetical protein JZ751_006799 [Albula glossodonta]